MTKVTCKITYTFCGEKFDFEDEKLRDIFEDLIKKENSISVYSALKLKEKDLNYLKELVSNWNKRILKTELYFSFLEDCDYFETRRILFLYYNIVDQLVNRGQIIELEGPTDKELKDFKEKVKKFTNYRYEVDRGNIGLIAQDRFLAYLVSLGINAISYEKRSNHVDSIKYSIDEYDIKVKDITLDVKCATDESYVYITPKVIVEEQKPKDFYVAIKYFKKKNKYLCLGFFEHSDLINYPFKFLYGTPFWGVYIYDAKPIKHLIDFLKAHGK